MNKKRFWKIYYVFPNAFQDDLLLPIIPKEIERSQVLYRFSFHLFIYSVSMILEIALVSKYKSEADAVLCKVLVDCMDNIGAN